MTDTNSTSILDQNPIYEAIFRDHGLFYHGLKCTDLELHGKVVRFVLWLQEVDEYNRVVENNHNINIDLFDFNVENYALGNWPGDNDDFEEAIRDGRIDPVKLVSEQLRQRVEQLFDFCVGNAGNLLWLPSLLYMSSRIGRNIHSKFIKRLVGEPYVFVPSGPPDIIDLFWFVFGVDHWIFEVMMFRVNHDRLECKYPSWVKELVLDIGARRQELNGGCVNEVNLYLRACMHFCYDLGRLPVMIHSYDEDELPISGTKTSVIDDITCPLSLMMVNKIITRNLTFGTLPNWNKLSKFDKLVVCSTGHAEWEQSTIEKLTGMRFAPCSLNIALEMVESTNWVHSNDFGMRREESEKVMDMIRMQQDLIEINHH